jgi:nucleoside-diphosphate-sugar epimerase
VNRAIIGYTGFVGGNLVRQQPFDAFYNSKNIEEIVGETFDFLVCAGAPAVKWLANKEPEPDRAAIDRLKQALAGVSVRKFVLISTVDVYPNPVDVDEDVPINTDNLHPYGKHRLELEAFVCDRFDTVTIRLPALFGDGLKKNIIYDFLHGNEVDKIHCDHAFQFYDLDRLSDDIQIVLDRDLSLVNFATEPTSVGAMARQAFGIDFTNRPHDRPIRYDMKTKYSDVFASNKAGYLYDTQQVLSALTAFVQKQRETSP